MLDRGRIEGERHGIEAVERRPLAKKIGECSVLHAQFAAMLAERCTTMRMLGGVVPPTDGPMGEVCVECTGEGVVLIDPATQQVITADRVRRRRRHVEPVQKIELNHSGIRHPGPAQVGRPVQERLGSQRPTRQQQREHKTLHNAPEVT